MAVGSPAPTSFAKVGPDSTAPGRRAQHLSRHLVRQQAGGNLESLGGPGDAGVRAQVRLDVLQRGAKRMRGHGDQRIARTVERLPQIGGDLQVVGECGVGQIALVAPRRAASSSICAPSRPHSWAGMAFARQLNGERRAPGTGADDRHRFWRRLLHALQPAS